MRHWQRCLYVVMCDCARACVYVCACARCDDTCVCAQRMPLRHPLCVALDYLGYRLVCMALLPISPATLQYGTYVGRALCHVRVLMVCATCLSVCIDDVVECVFQAQLTVDITC
jgi:hypothetical protein